MSHRSIKLSKSIYLAARYSRREEIRGYKINLENKGFVVTSRWLEDISTDEEHILVNKIEESDNSIPIEARILADIDVSDVMQADTLILFSETPVSKYARGGRHVEFGIALASNKRVIVIGPRENIFHTLENVEHFDCLDDKVINYLIEV